MLIQYVLIKRVLALLWCFMDFFFTLRKYFIVVSLFHYLPTLLKGISGRNCVQVTGSLTEKKNKAPWIACVQVTNILCRSCQKRWDQKGTKWIEAMDSWEGIFHGPEIMMKSRLDGKGIWGASEEEAIREINSLRGVLCSMACVSDCLRPWHVFSDTKEDLTKPCLKLILRMWQESAYSGKRVGSFIMSVHLRVCEALVFGVGCYSEDHFTKFLMTNFLRFIFFFEKNT